MINLENYNNFMSEVSSPANVPTTERVSFNLETGNNIPGSLNAEPFITNTCSDKVSVTEINNKTEVIQLSLSRTELKCMYKFVLSNYTHAKESMKSGCHLRSERENDMFKQEVLELYSIQNMLKVALNKSSRTKSLFGLEYDENNIDDIITCIIK